jgi:hypothetical protein
MTGMSVPGAFSIGARGAFAILAAPAAVGVVTGATILNDITIAIANPSVQSILMQTNGTTLLLTTSTIFGVGVVDLSKITITVSDKGWNTSGAMVDRTRTIRMREFLRGPYNESTYYAPITGQFYIVLDDFCYNQDATWKTTVTSINCAADWLRLSPSSLATTPSPISSSPCRSRRTRSPLWRRAIPIQST